MNKVNEQRIKLRIDYANETQEMFENNIPKYADWLENKLAALTEQNLNKHGVSNKRDDFLDAQTTPTEPLPAEGSAKGVSVELTDEDIKWLHQKPVDMDWIKDWIKGYDRRVAPFAHNKT
jgi:hypothetical protein